jgi:hypothetical protein
VAHDLEAAAPHAHKAGEGGGAGGTVLVGPGGALAVVAPGAGADGLLSPRVPAGGGGGGLLGSLLGPQSRAGNKSAHD